MHISLDTFPAPAALTTEISLASTFLALAHSLPSTAMHRSWVLLPLSAFIALACWSYSFKHLHDTAESILTSLRFSSVKNVAFMYPQTSASPQMVPKIMHHIWLDEDCDNVPGEYAAALESCVKLHPVETG